MRLPVAALLLLALPLAPARAAQSYDNCTGFVDALPAVIGTQGVWCLRKDLSTAITTGAAITITNNNVTLDCNHFKIGGLAAGAATQARGVLVEDRLGFTMRNCNVRGFFYGVRSTGGAGHLVEGNRFEASTSVGIRISSDQSAIRNNFVLDTGGSSYDPSVAAGIGVGGSEIIVHDNIISGLDPLAADGSVRGINVAGLGAGFVSVARNTIGGLDPDATGTVNGIYVGLGSILIHDNALHGPESNPAAVAIYCASAEQHTARGNLVAKFATGVSGCYDSGNVVNPN